MADEAVKRRSTFRDGIRVRLADGQFWTFPAPPKERETKPASFGAEYAGLIECISEAEKDSERRLAEFSFAIFLLGYNYALSSADYERILGFAPDSRELADWQCALHRIAQEHRESFEAMPNDSIQSRPLIPNPGPSARILVWLRNLLPSRWWSFNS